MSLVHCGRRCGYPLNWPVGDVRAAVKHVKDHAKTAAVCFMRRICWLVRDYIAAGYLPVACGGSGGPAWARNRAGRPSRSVGETQGSRASCARYLYFSTPWGGILETRGFIGSATTAPQTAGLGLLHAPPRGSCNGPPRRVARALWATCIEPRAFKKCLF